ncbi:MAG: LysM domain-containing protein [Bacillota bacterium]
MTSKKETAYQFIVNGQKWFTVSSKDSLDSILDEYQKHYLAKIDENAQVKSIAFQQKIEIVEVEVKPEEIDTLEAAKEKIYAGEEEVTIEVKRGDNLWNLAKANNLTVSEMEILNPETGSTRLRDGKLFMPV